MKVKNLIMLLSVVALTSCVGLTKVTVPQSNVNIVGRDMETQRHVSYTLKKTYVFGIGGCSERARNTNIIDELMKKANLQKNEALAYISVSKNVNTYAGVVTIAKFTASGYVVRPVGNASVAMPSNLVGTTGSEARTNEDTVQEQGTASEYSNVQEEKESLVVPENRCKLVTFPDGTKGVVFGETDKGELLVVSVGEKKLHLKEAKAWCESLGEGWRLPTKSELLMLFNVSNEQKGISGPIAKALVNFGGPDFRGKYCTDTESYVVSAGGVEEFGNVKNTYKVRAVRIYKE